MDFKVTKLIASFCKDQVLVWSNFLRLQGGRRKGRWWQFVQSLHFWIPLPTLFAPYSNCTHNANTHLGWRSCRTVAKSMNVLSLRSPPLLICSFVGNDGSLKVTLQKLWWNIRTELRPIIDCVLERISVFVLKRNICLWLTWSLFGMHLGMEKVHTGIMGAIKIWHWHK